MREQRGPIYRTIKLAQAAREMTTTEGSRMTYRGCVVNRRASHEAVIMVAMEISQEERARRRAVVDQARASSALEGQESHEQAHADQEAYVRGDIDVDELVRRAQAYR